MLSLLARACTLRADGGDASGAKRAKRAIESRLAKLHDKTMRDGRRFERLDPPRQHRVRKRLKRLRYLAEFTAPLHDRDALDAFLSKLRKAQDALGEYNDEMNVAIDRVMALTATPPQALDAVEARLQWKMNRVMNRWDAVKVARLKEWSEYDAR